MRVHRLLPALLGLAVLSGCGGGSSSVGNSLTGTRKLHYTLTDLGGLPTKAIQATASVSRLTSLLRPAALSTRATDLTDLGGALVDLHGVAINNAAQIVTTSGNVFDANTQGHAFLYHSGTKTTIGTLGGSVSYGYSVNDSGQAVGASALAGDNNFHAYLYSQGAVTDLGTLGGPNSTAYAINNAGQVVGISDTVMPPTSDPSNPSSVISITVDTTTYNHPFLYQNGHMRDLGTVSGYESTPYAINDKGLVVGRAVAMPTSTNADDLLAVAWNSDGVTTLPTLGGTWSGAYGVNNSGLIVGQSSTGGKPGDSNFYLRAVTWQDGKVTNLGTLPGGNHSLALGVNAAGDIVGGSTKASSGVDAYYDLGFILPHNGTMQNLNELIPADSGWLLLSALSINDAGQIVGIGRIGKEEHAYLLTPDNTATTGK